MATSSPERDRSFDPPESAFLFFAYAVSASIATIYCLMRGPVEMGGLFAVTAFILWTTFALMWWSHHVNVTRPQPELLTVRSPWYTRAPWLALQAFIVGGMLWLWYTTGDHPGRPEFTLVFGFAIGAAWLVTMILTAWIEVAKSIARKVKGRSHRSPPPPDVASPYLPEHRARLHREPAGPRRE